jgi:hypothetical protein
MRQAIVLVQSDDDGHAGAVSGFNGILDRNGHVVSNGKREAILLGKGFQSSLYLILGDSNGVLNTLASERVMSNRAQRTPHGALKTFLPT